MDRLDRHSCAGAPLAPSETFLQRDGFADSERRRDPQVEPAAPSILELTAAVARLAEDRTAAGSGAPMRAVDLDWLRALARDPRAQLGRTRDQFARAQRGAPPEVELDALREQLGRALYWALRDALEAEGMEGEIVSRVALRAAQQAVMRKVGFGQCEIATLQDIGLTTAKEDAARVRAVLLSGALEAKASRRLPKVPVPPTARLSVPPTLMTDRGDSRR